MFPDTLQTVTLHFVPMDECVAAYEEIVNIDDTMICASGDDEMDPTNNADTCSIDSGGPLIIACEAMDAVGLASFGEECALTGFPGVYTKVGDPRMLDWIDEIMIFYEKQDNMGKNRRMRENKQKQIIERQSIYV